MGPTVGIDLGTSTSEIAVFAHGEARVQTIDQDGPITPSAVWETPGGELVVGSTAYRQPGALKEFKRLMGESSRLPLGGRVCSPQECSAYVLKFLVSRCQENLRQEIESAVITVPASWRDQPRRATQEAGRLAGIEVARLINEPTAAAMAFGIRRDAEGKTIAVYDLGGGTFDVTILKIESQVFDVVTSVGDPYLGGTDIDDLLLRHTLDQVALTTGYRHQLQQDPEVAWALKLACEAAKKELSTAQDTLIRLPFLGTHAGRPVSVEVPIGRPAFEGLIEPLIKQSLDYLAEALRRARLPKDAIDEIVLVGGSTRIPRIRQRVAEFMGKEPNSSAVNPDEAVALGAAIQASLIDRDEQPAGGPAPGGVVILDNTTSDLGVETLVMINDEPVTGVFATIIERDRKLPASATKEFATVADNQKRLQIKCYQGNGKWVSQNAFVGEPIVIDGLPPRPAGGVKFEITFSLDLNALLDVSVRFEDAGISASRRFDLSAGLGTAEERGRRAQAVATSWERSEMARSYQPLLDEARRKLQGTLAEALRSALGAALLDLERALAAGSKQAAEHAEQVITNLLFDLV
jgi:molecular chaperone DnaK